MPPSD